MNASGDNKDDLLAAFGSRLKATRVRRGFKTARAFADHSGITEKSYMRYELGQVEPGIRALVTICKCLQISPNELLDFKEQSNVARLERKAPQRQE